MLANKTIVLGICGGIAVYKVADLASKLVQAGSKVRVIMTESAQEFVLPLTFEAITTNQVVTDMFQTNSEHRMNHISLSEVADAIIVAPATANIIAKIAAGIADNMLTTTILATRAPIIIAPSMHTCMWENSVTQENIAKLKKRGFHIVEPGIGRLASGGFGAGRLPDTETLMGHLQLVLGKKGDLSGRNIVVTAGGTQEAIDPVRVITNRSSGKMGYALAEAARDRGATVTLITAPTSLGRPVGIIIEDIETTVELQDAVNAACTKADVLIMAAAPADFRVKQLSENKIKKDKGTLTLELINNPDILAELKSNCIKIGFAAESQDLLANAKKKLTKKNLDLIVANNIHEKGIGFGSNDNKVSLLDRQGNVEDIPVMNKRAVADVILDKVVKLIKAKAPKRK